MKITALGRTLSLLEGPTLAAVTRAKAYSSAKGIDLMQDPNRTFQRMRGFRNMYLQGGYVATGIDLYPLYTLGEGGYWKAMTKRQKKRSRGSSPR